MTPTRWTWRVGLLGLAVCCGCQEPPQIIPATPPGIAPPPPTLPPGSEAQAIGEQRPSALVAPESKTAPDGATAPSAVQIEVLTPGTGAEAKAGQRVTVHYTGTLTDGTKFDSSRDKGQPLSFTLGAGDVIKGWDDGLPGMKVGEHRKLTIPPVLGYGAEGWPPKVPPNATLIFDVELLDAKDVP